MRLITDPEELAAAERFLTRAQEVARKRATCTRAKCGAVIVRDGEVIGEGYNSPPAEDESQRRCANAKDGYHPKVTDKTCCVHAEERAIMDALRKGNGERLRGATLYFARYYADGAMRRMGDKDGKAQPYCTICTKMMHDVGIAEFVLFHRDGVVAIPAPEYLERSYGYGSYSWGIEKSA